MYKHKCLFIISRRVESTTLKQVEIDASKNESKYRIEKHRIQNIQSEKSNEEYRAKIKRIEEDNHA